MDTRMRLNRWRVGMLAASTVAVMVMPALGQTPSFTMIPPAPGAFASHVTGLSADGRVIAGYNELSGDINASGFTWTAAGGRNDFGLAAGPSVYTRPYGISADGTTLVGDYFASSGVEGAFRYRVGGSVDLLPTPSGFRSAIAYSATADGNTIAGSVYGNGQGLHATRWTSAGAQVVGLARPNDLGAEFKGVSRDGSTYIGISGGSGPNTYEPYTWTQTGGWNQLPVPTTVVQPYDSETTAVNRDGSIVMGYARGRTGVVTGLIWTDGVPAALRVLPGFTYGVAGSPTDDGRLFAGSLSATNGTAAAAVWTDPSHPVLLSNYLAARGVSLPAGWTLRGGDVSSDGLVFAGNASGPANEVRGFVATVPTPSTLGALLGTAGIMQRRRRVVNVPA